MVPVVLASDRNSDHVGSRHRHRYELVAATRQYRGGHVHDRADTGN